MNYKFLKIPVLLLFVCGVLAQQPARIQHDVKYLASDELEGRLTGSKGATEAARYIANEFKKVGLKPLAEGANRSESRYFQQFPYVADVSLGKHNTLTFGEDVAQLKLDAGTDWLPLGFSSSAKVEGPI